MRILDHARSGRVLTIGWCHFVRWYLILAMPFKKGHIKHGTAFACMPPGWLIRRSALSCCSRVRADLSPNAELLLKSEWIALIKTILRLCLSRGRLCCAALLGARQRSTATPPTPARLAWARLALGFFVAVASRRWVLVPNSAVPCPWLGGDFWPRGLGAHAQQASCIPVLVARLP